MVQEMILQIDKSKVLSSEAVDILCVVINTPLYGDWHLSNIYFVNTQKIIGFC